MQTPLIDSGTTGYLGQVMPIMKGVTECYECSAKPTQKVYPICTIRSTPDKVCICVCVCISLDCKIRATYNLLNDFINYNYINVNGIILCPLPKLTPFSPLSSPISAPKHTQLTQQ